MVEKMKDLVIRNILLNGTYLPDSGLYQKVAKSLQKLPLDSLSSLELIVNIRILDAADAAKDGEAD